MENIIKKETSSSERKIVIKLRKSIIKIKKKVNRGLRLMISAKPRKIKNWMPNFKRLRLKTSTKPENKKWATKYQETQTSELLQSIK